MWQNDRVVEVTQTEKLILFYWSWTQTPTVCPHVTTPSSCQHSAHINTLAPPSDFPEASYINPLLMCGRSLRAREYWCCTFERLLWRLVSFFLWPLVHPEGKCWCYTDQATRGATLMHIQGLFFWAVLDSGQDRSVCFWWHSLKI